MAPLPTVCDLRAVVGARLADLLRGEEALRADELASSDDPGLFGPDSTVWVVHADTAMLIGGLRALLLQTLHPLAMAGVADHSDYRNDPWGRLRRTSRFIGATTYGSTATAERELAIVDSVHERVEGVAPDGRPYRANDPHLLLWVHITEVDSFLRAHELYGGHPLSSDDADRYVSEMATIARRLGSSPPPTSRDELEASLTRFRSECTVTPAAVEASRFLLRPPVPAYLAPSYHVITGAAVALLPPWARQQLRLPVLPGADTLAIRPAAALVTRLVGWLLAPAMERSSDDGSAAQRATARVSTAAA